MSNKPLAEALTRIGYAMLEAAEALDKEDADEPPFPTEAPLEELPPAAQPHPNMQAQAPTTATAPVFPPFPAARQWAVGSVHAQGHNPLQTNRRGLYCPTKLPDGSWCQWRP